MREFIIHKKTEGNLLIENFNETLINVICEYEDDYYSNKNLKGSFRLIDYSAELANFLSGEIHKFTFTDSLGLKIVGRIFGQNYRDSERYRLTLSFDILTLTTHTIYLEEVPSKLKVSFKTPYIDIFARDLCSSHNFSHDYIIKFDSEEFVLELTEYSIIFKEFINFLPHKEPDSIFTRLLYPTIEISLVNEVDMFTRLDNCVQYVSDVFVIISFVLNKRLGAFGFEAEFFINTTITRTIESKDGKINVGENYINKNYYRLFKDFFKKENLSLLINNYFNLPITDRDELKRIIYRFISLKEMKSFEPQVISLVSCLEGISKIFVDPKRYPKKDNRHYYYTEELINLAILKSQIKTQGLEFEKTDIEKSFLIEYRNYLIHFNSKEEFDKKKIFQEYNKAYILVRKLVLSYLSTSLSDFPFPNEGDNELDNFVLP